MPKVMILKSGGDLTASKAAEMLKDGTAHKRLLNGPQKKYFRAVAHGWKKPSKKKAEDGLHVEGNQYTPISDDTIQLGGKPHSEGGTDIHYFGKNVEAEKGETATLQDDGSLTILGNMINPLSGHKFKEDSKRIANKERRASKLTEEGLELLKDSSPSDKWSRLTFNSGRIMAIGGDAKMKELKQTKDHLSSIQRAMLERSDELGVDPQEFSKGALTAKNGATMKAQDGKNILSEAMGIKPYVPVKDSLDINKLLTPKQFRNSDYLLKYPGYKEPFSKRGPISTTSNSSSLSSEIVDPSILGSVHDKSPQNIGNTSTNSDATLPEWDFRGTNTTGLDQKILDFLPLMEKNGLTGYSGRESGVSMRNTTSGRLSRHAQKQALDAFINQPDAYNKILSNPDLTKYLIDNGLTIINEYDPNVAKQTGATAGHIHIGYDQGTAVSDQFRKDAASRYRTSNPDWNWGMRVKAGESTPIKGGFTGDIPYNPNYKPITPIDYTKGIPDNIYLDDQGLPHVKGSDAPLELSPYTEPNAPTNAKKLSLDQVLPELYTAATNREVPVWMQKYNPQLFQPYQVSFQDRLNENQSTFNALKKAAAYDPAALSTLAGKKYEADSQALAEQFRTNQQIQNEVTNKNIALLNEAQNENLKLADTQATRQAEAKAFTKAQNRTILSSIADKLHQNELEQMTQKVYENLYPNYRFDPKTGKANFYGNGKDYINWDNPEGITPINNIGVGTNNPGTGQKVSYDPYTGKIKNVLNITPNQYELTGQRYRALINSPLGQMLKQPLPGTTSSIPKTYKYKNPNYGVIGFH